MMTRQRYNDCWTANLVPHVLFDKGSFILVIYSNVMFTDKVLTRFIDSLFFHSTERKEILLEALWFFFGRNCTIYVYIISYPDEACLEYRNIELTHMNPKGSFKKKK